MRKFILMLLVMAPAFVFAVDSTAELTVFGGYRGGGELFAKNIDFVDTNLDVDGAATFGLSLGVPLSSRWSLEFLVDHQATELLESGGQFGGRQYFADFDVTYYHIGARFQWTSAKVRPYIVFSLGIASLDIDLPGARGEDEFSTSFGGGVRVPFSDHLGLRVEGRGFCTETGTNNWDWDDCDHDCGHRYENDDLWQAEVTVGLVVSF